jgi:glycosyltransferase involved in cell wall biosynthesis
MSREQLLVITERYWPDGSGAELATHLIIDILRKEKALEITVITGSRNPMRLPGVRYIYEPLLSAESKSLPLLWLNTNKLIKREEFRKILQESDVVYVPGFMFSIIPYAKSMGKRVVVHLHNYVPVSYTSVILAPYEEHKHKIVYDNIRLECMRDAKHCIGVSLLWWLPMLIRKWVSQADKIICVSKRQTDIITDLVPELAGKIKIMYNPLPSELMNANINKEIDDVPTFIYTGGDVYVKGFHIVASIIRRWRSRARFILTKINNREVANTLSRLNDEFKKIEVYPKLSRAEFIKLYSRSWAFLFPSIFEETFGYAFIEAALSRTVPIAFRVGGVGEVVEGTVMENFITDVYNIKQFIEKMYLISSLSSNDIITLGDKIRNDILKKFNVETIKNNLIKEFL